MDENQVFPVDNEDDDVVVTLNLDDGSEVTCEIITIFEVDEQDYIVLIPWLRMFLRHLLSQLASVIL